MSRNNGLYWYAVIPTNQTWRFSKVFKGSYYEMKNIGWYYRPLVVSTASIKSDIFLALYAPYPEVPY